MDANAKDMQKNGQMLEAHLRYTLLNMAIVYIQELLQLCTCSTCSFFTSQPIVKHSHPGHGSGCTYRMIRIEGVYRTILSHHCRGQSNKVIVECSTHDRHLFCALCAKYGSKAQGGNTRTISIGDVFWSTRHKRKLTRSGSRSEVRKQCVGPYSRAISRSDTDTLSEGNFLVTSRQMLLI